jgi:hypothetical protein
MKYFKFSNKLFALLFMITSMMFVGCQKEEQKNLISENQLSTEIRTTVQPTVENGTLKFNNFQEVVDYVSEVDDILKDELISENSLEVAEEVNTFKNYSDYLKTNRNFVPLYDSSEKGVDGEISNNILGSSSFYFVFNPYHEIIVGDKLYVQKNRYEYYLINKNDSDNKLILRSLKIGESLGVEHYNSDIDIVTFDKEVVKRTKECDCSFSLEKSNVSSATHDDWILKFSCGDTKIFGKKYTLRVWDQNKNEIVNLHGTVTSPTKGEITFKVSKATSFLDVKFCLLMDCGDGEKNYCFDIKKDLSSNCCRKKIDIVEDKVIPNSGIKMVNKLHNGLFLGLYFHESRIECRRESDGKRLRANITQTLDVSIRNPNDCLVTQSDSDSDSCNNCTYNQERIYFNSANANGTDWGWQILGDGVFKNTVARAGHLGVHTITPDYCN